MTTYLLEIGCEEIPARFMSGLLSDLHESVEAALVRNRVGFESVECKGTYRRLVLFVHGIATKQEDLEEEVKGPPAKIAMDENGVLLPPGLGFVKRYGLNPKAIEKKELGGQDYLVAVRKEKGQEINQLLPELISTTVKGLNLAIAMKWGNSQEVFVRPIHWVLSLLDDQIVPLTLYGIQAENITYAHRMLTNNPNRNTLISGEPIQIKIAAEYESKLKKKHVILDQKERVLIVQEFLEKECMQKNIDKSLLQEVGYLVECPTVLMGRFDRSYLDIPQEALIQCMKKHQKYFPIYSSKGELENRFAIVADSVTPKSIANIIKGNENVLIARLEDVRFFFEEDQKKSLEKQIEKLEKVLFLKGVGSIKEKVDRIQALCAYLAPILGYEVYAQQIQKAALLSKTDLVSLMVYELPELQGVMGNIYASIQGADEMVATGIEQHYWPLHTGADVSSVPTGIVVGIADKIDTIVACFAIGKIPTGSQDPLGIRRAVLGIAETLLKNELSVDLIALIERVYQLLGQEEKNKEKLIDFIKNRYKKYLQDQGLAYDTVNAILSLSVSDIVAAKRVGQALEKYKSDYKDAFKCLVETGVRVGRLAKKAAPGTQVDPELFKDKIEKICYEIYLKSDRVVFNDPYERFMDLAGFSESIIAYFEQVLVMDKDEKIRNNRLAFLRQLDALFSKCGDLESIII